MMNAKNHDYGVRVIKPYGFFHAGRVIYPPGILRDRLVQIGCVERLTGPVESPVQEVVKAAPVQEAMKASDAQASFPLPKDNRPRQPARGQRKQDD